MSVRLGNFLIILGIAICAAATVWWIVFFYDILGDEFQVARECFYMNTNLCALKSSASLFSDIPVYSPKLLWAGCAAFVIGLGMRMLKFRH